MDTRRQPLLSGLNDEETRWLFDVGLKQHLVAGEHLYGVGDTVNQLYVMLDGLLESYNEDTDGQRTSIRQFVPPDIIGESIWISGSSAVETVGAVENSLVLGISAERLNQKRAEDTLFATHFMQVVARSMAERLHCSLQAGPHSGGHRLGASTQKSIDPKEQLSLALRQLKCSLFEADRAALTNGGTMPLNIEEELQKQFRAFCAFVNTVIGDDAALPAAQKEDIGAMVLQELLPYLCMAESERWYSKPSGYAGDYLTIVKIYADQPTGSGRLGRFLDKCLLGQPAPVAVRNRRKLFQKQITSLVDSVSLGPVRVMSLGCGPAQELFDVYDDLTRPNILHGYLVDIDTQALSYVAEKRDRQNLTQNINLYQNNLIYLARGRERIDVPPQDFVYSVGVIDYFSDENVVWLINYAFDLLKPGGKLILGNFHPKNVDKAMMDHVFQWILNHRSEADMDRLFLRSRFGRACSNIHFEDQGINLFAECIKTEG